jgi:hypothetical protein
MNVDTRGRGLKFLETGGQAEEGLAKFASCAPPKLAKTKSSENVLSGD